MGLKDWKSSWYYRATKKRLSNPQAYFAAHHVAETGLEYEILCGQVLRQASLIVFLQAEFLQTGGEVSILNTVAKNKPKQSVYTTCSAN